MSDPEERGAARADAVLNDADRWACQTLSGRLDYGPFLYWWSVADVRFFHFERRALDQEALHEEAYRVDAEIRRLGMQDPWTKPDPWAVS